ncbi:hypothetical protein HRW18_36330 [Streptomyces lunaelactis]|uniref:hypothetical protein n=1 Tax=Streptomyces lunaelactis TaxID=1535768 RepID=UPI00158460AF|nr:hypothetical protein [Streptomyces lunaelactis]NUK13319.1 hypothetical protein [Streptomyces lunaelactis]NUK35290.1 hypothetical protein [Streptomyces lunaelactis]NUK41878.1 hypothetical protein [Streptomyces lunaelactis]NUK56903.1 hypothetical protein [Streptomyces lunaelactis]NUK92226.1 hypothetical protein [Streptomyces lunaelactis]
MDRTVDPQVLAIALGEHEAGLLLTPDELAELIARVEVGAIRAGFVVSEDWLGTAWYLHGVAAASVPVSDVLVTDGQVGVGRAVIGQVARPTVLTR